MVSRNVCHDTRTLPGIVLEDQGSPVGLLQYHITDRQWEIVVIISLRERLGYGSRMLSELAALARSSDCQRLWVVTTNDNADAQRFYRAHGGHEVAIHRGAVLEARRLKPEIPECSDDGTPITDEIEYEFPLHAGEHFA